MSVIGKTLAPATAGRPKKADNLERLQISPAGTKSTDRLVARLQAER
jgi:hypothetical protein